jgi:hypothetical protein
MLKLDGSDQVSDRFKKNGSASAAKNIMALISV